MDYEKALEKDRAAYGTGAYDDATLEFIFPQIKESEEEKRKRAVAVLEQQRYYWAYEGPADKTRPATKRKDLVEAIDVALSYLEKQKEATPCSVDEFTLTLRNCLSVDSELTKEQADIFATAYGEELLNVAIGKIKSGLTEEDITDFKSEKQKEQKPVEWSEEDENKRTDAIYFLKCSESHYVLPENISKIEATIDWLKSLRSQPKQEWSGVDDLRLHQTIDVCDRNGYPVLSMWLKRLPRRVTLQSSCNPAWRIWRNGACGNSGGNPIALVKESCGYKLVSCLGADGEKYIMLSDLEKLPGFNEK